MKKTSRLSAWLPALLALSLAAGSALAQERARFKLAEQLPAAETVRYAVIDSHAPPQPVDTVDLQVLAEERLLHHPHAFVRAGLNEKLAREGEEQDRALVEKYFGGKTLELKEFEVRLSREYPSDTRYMNAGAMQGGLIGVLVGAIMDLSLIHI